MRNFNNDHADNCYVFGVFDACRIAKDDAKVRNICSESQCGSDSDDIPEIVRYKSIKNKKIGNLYIVFSCEPTKVTPSVGVTMALVERL